ncbi:MAG: CPBP family intramembrane glutamic endopeptidase [Verrucomicrobiota bacterium]|nr:CPBP family intramembrane glutamic endopeptidase [Verrucomicrobiota bacterium]
MSRGTLLQSDAFKILVFIAGTVVLGALLAPFLYVGGKHVVAEGWLEGTLLDDINGSMDRAKFSRYFNRAILLGGFIMILPTVRWLNAGKKKRGSVKEFINLDPNPAWWRHLLIGFVAGGASLLVLGSGYVAQGWYVMKDTDKPLYEVLLEALGTGIAVGLLEELVFRGALYAVLAKLLKPKPLFYGVAALFAVLHFFNPPHGLTVEVVHAGSGFWFVGRIFQHFFSQFGDLYFLLSEFAVLFAIGLVLGYTREKTGSLWLGIGLHAGWVFGVKTLSPLTTRAFDRDAMMPWLGDTLRVGAVSFFVVALTGLVIWLWLRKTGNPESVEPGAEG